MRLVEPAIVPTPWKTAFWKCGPTLYLTWQELDCRDKDRTPYPEEWRRSRAVPLAIEFEWIRATAGGLPIEIGSGYRTWPWNRKRHGARHSQHPRGTALDLYPPTNLRMPGFVDAVLLVAHRPESRIRGVGVYRTFVHFDIRGFDFTVPPMRIARWRGSRISPEVWNKVRDV